MKERFQSGLQQYALNFLAALSVAVGMLLFCWTLLLWFRWHPHLPWRDVFVILDDFQPILSGEWGWRDWLFLFEAHYSAHRITLPRLLVYWDLTLLSGRGHLLYASAWAGLLVIFVLYVRASRDYFRGNPAVSWFCCGILGILLFAPAHFWNLTNAINSSWHVSFALAALAFYLLLRKPGSLTVLDWLLAYGLATVAAFTNFAGVIVWLLLPVIALRDDRRVFLVTLACSVLLTLAYLNGIASDADIAAAWNTGDPAVAARIQEAGRAAIEQNSLLRIVQGASVVLCWPLSEARPALAAVFFGFSLIVLVIGWIQFLRAAFASQRLQPWIEWCLLLATLALGVALAIQFGRLIEQPNHAHGPSYERYNTAVAMYWAGISSLSLSVVPRLSAVGRLVAMLLTLLIVYCLLAPGGRYLQQEIASTEAAARLYAAGETPALREQLDSRLLRFKPEYVFTFDQLFEAGGLAYRWPVRLPGDPGLLSLCSPEFVVITRSKGKKTGFGQLQLRISGMGAMLTRDVLLSREGKLLSRLYPSHRGDYSPVQLLRPSFSRWIGYIDDKTTLDGNVQVTFNMIAGTSRHCLLQVGNREKLTSLTESLPQVSGDV